jgi:hypothetical protein
LQIALPYYYGQNLHGLSYRFTRITTDGDPIIDAASVASDLARIGKLPAIQGNSYLRAFVDHVFSIGR